MTSLFSQRYRAFIGHLTLVCLLGLPSASVAQDTNCTTQNLDECLSDEQATALVEALSAARRAADEGDWTQSIGFLQQAETVVSLGVTRAAIARALFELQRIEEARAICLALLEDPDPDARALASTLLTELEPAAEVSGTVEPEDMPEDVVVEPTTPPQAQVSDNPTPSDLTTPTVLRRRRQNVALWTFAGASIAVLVPGIWAGMRSQTLEDEANDYDLTAENASRAEQDDLGRSSARHATAANALFIASGVFTGAVIGILIERSAARPSLSIAPTDRGVMLGFTFSR
jgi:hypothetical protein